MAARKRSPKKKGGARKGASPSRDEPTLGKRKKRIAATAKGKAKKKSKRVVRARAASRAPKKGARTPSRKPATKKTSARKPATKKTASRKSSAKKVTKRSAAVRKAADARRAREAREAAKRAASARKAAETRRANKAKREAEEARRAEEARLAKEARRAEKARRAAEEEARRAEDARRIEEARRVEQEDARRQAEEEARAAEAAADEEAKKLSVGRAEQERVLEESVRALNAKGKLPTYTGHPPTNQGRYGLIITVPFNRIFTEEDLEDLVEKCVEAATEINDMLEVRASEIGHFGVRKFWSTWEFLAIGFRGPQGKSPTAEFKAPTSGKDPLVMAFDGHPKVRLQRYEAKLREALARLLLVPCYLLGVVVGGTANDGSNRKRRRKGSRSRGRASGQMVPASMNKSTTPSTRTAGPRGHMPRRKRGRGRQETNSQEAKPATRVKSVRGTYDRRSK